MNTDELIQYLNDKVEAVTNEMLDLNDESYDLAFFEGQFEAYTNILSELGAL